MLTVAFSAGIATIVNEVPFLSIDNGAVRCVFFVDIAGGLFAGGLLLRRIVDGRADERDVFLCALLSGVDVTSGGCVFRRFNEEERCVRALLRFLTCFGLVFEAGIKTLSEACAAEEGNAMEVRLSISRTG